MPDNLPRANFASQNQVAIGQIGPSVVHLYTIHWLFGNAARWNGKSFSAAGVMLTNQMAWRSPRSGFKSATCRHRTLTATVPSTSHSQRYYTMPSNLLLTDPELPSSRLVSREHPGRLSLLGVLWVANRGGRVWVRLAL